MGAALRARANSTQRTRDALPSHARAHAHNAHAKKRAAAAAATASPAPSPQKSMRKHAPVLAGTCDLLVCDEGHRLKSAGGSKTMDALLSIGCERRVVLTGTPVQNK